MGICGAFGAYAGFSVSTNYGYYVHDGKVGLGAVDDGSLSAVFGGPGVGKHTTVITKTAYEDTMKLCLQMLNYAYTEEGMLYWNYGDEGVSWEYDIDEDEEKNREITSGWRYPVGISFTTEESDKLDEIGQEAK